MLGTLRALTNVSTIDVTRSRARERAHADSQHAGERTIAYRRPFPSESSPHEIAGNRHKFAKSSSTLEVCRVIT